MRPLRAPEPTPDPTDGEIVRRVLDGDRAAYRHLVDRHQSRVFRLCLRLLGRTADAEDASQDAFVRAFDALARFDPARPFAAWILEIGLNACRDRRRAAWWRRVLLASEPAEHIADPVPAPDVRLDEARRRAALLECLQKLRPRDREALAFLDGEVPAAEAARLLGITPNALYVRQNRARARLLDLLREAHPDLFDEP